VRAFVRAGRTRPRCSCLEAPGPPNPSWSAAGIEVQRPRHPRSSKRARGVGIYSAVARGHAPGDQPRWARKEATDPLGPKRGRTCHEGVNRCRPLAPRPPAAAPGVARLVRRSAGPISGRSHSAYAGRTNLSPRHQLFHPIESEALLHRADQESKFSSRERLGSPDPVRGHASIRALPGQRGSPAKHLAVRRRAGPPRGRPDVLFGLLAVGLQGGGTLPTVYECFAAFVVLRRGPGDRNATTRRLSRRSGTAATRFLVWPARARSAPACPGRERSGSGCSPRSALAST